MRAPVLILAVLLLRLRLMWRRQAIPPHFYCDSVAHSFNAWLLAANGFSKNDPRSLNLAYLLYAAALKAGMSVLRAPWAVNGLLAALSAILLYDAVRRLAGPAAATLAGLLGISVPAFSRLIFSGQPEMTALCMATLAFWLSVRGRSLAERGRYLMDLAAVAALGLSFLARLEMIGALALSLVVLAVVWRRRPGFLVAALCAGLAFVVLRHAWFGARLQAAYQSNSAAWDYDLQARLLRIPRWVAFGFFPLNLAAVCALGNLRRRPWATPLGALTAVLLGQGALLYAGSCFYIGSVELERNMAAICFLAMAPAAAVVVSAARRLAAPLRWGGLGLLALLLGCSWRSEVGLRPAVPEIIGGARDLGFELRRQAARGALGSDPKAILFETSDLVWEDAAAFSGMPRRFRLFPRASVSSPANNWDGAADFDVLLVRSRAQEARFKARFASLRLIESYEGYRIYRKDPAPAGPAA